MLGRKAEPGGASRELAISGQGPGAGARTPAGGAREPGVRGGGGELGERLREALEAEPGFARYGLKAEHLGDGYVRLSGIVDVLAEKRRAEEIAWRVPGVQRVDNALTISTDGSITDADVEAEVMEELKSDPTVDVGRIGASVKGGVAYLQGRVNSLAEAKAAADAASRARGVRDIQSQLTIAPDLAELDDATLTNRIETAMAGDPRVSGLRVRTQTEDGVVELYGEVSNAAQMEIAEEIAASVPGVRRVINRLKEAPASPPAESRSQTPQ